MQKQSQAYIYAITAVLLWSTAASAFKLTLRHVHYIQMLLGASTVSLVFLFGMLLARRKLYLLRRYSMKDYFTSLFLGMLNPFLYYIILFKAYSLLTAQEALTLNYTWPIMLAILSIPILKQPITVQSICAIIISFIGVFIIATGGNVLEFSFTNGYGVVLALSSSFIWALFWIYNTKEGDDEIARLFLNFFFGCALILVTAIVFSAVNVSDTRGLIGMVYIGLFEMGLTFVLWLKALRLSGTTAQIGNLVYISPFFSLVFIRLFVGEKIAVSTVIGLIFIIAGIFLQYYISPASVMKKTINNLFFKN